MPEARWPGGGDNGPMEQRRNLELAGGVPATRAQPQSSLDTLNACAPAGVAVSSYGHVRVQPVAPASSAQPALVGGMLARGSDVSSTAAPGARRGVGFGGSSSVTFEAENTAPRRAESSKNVAGEAATTGATPGVIVPKPALPSRQHTGPLPGPYGGGRPAGGPVPPQDTSKDVLDTSFGARRTENFGSSLNERSRILRSQHTVSHLLSQDTNRATSADKKAELEVFKKEVLSVRDQVSERLQRRSHAHSRTACGWDAHGCS